MTSPRTMESSMVASVGITDSCLSGMERPDLVITCLRQRRLAWAMDIHLHPVKFEDGGDSSGFGGRLSPLQTAAAAEAAFSPRSLPEARLPPTIPCFS